MKIDWRKVWEELEDWSQHQEKRCTSCHGMTYFPTWEAQQRKIQKLVEQQMGRK